MIRPAQLARVRLTTPNSSAARRAATLAAMEQLLARHFGYVNNLCKRILRDPIDAEDARQDALIQAARMIQTFDGRSAFRTWLHSLTRNVCLNAIRSASRRAIPVDEPPEAKLSVRTAHGGRRPTRGEVVDPHDRIAGRVDVDAALAAVTPAYQDALSCGSSTTSTMH